MLLLPLLLYIIYILNERKGTKLIKIVVCINGGSETPFFTIF